MKNKKLLMFGCNFVLLVTAVAIAGFYCKPKEPSQSIDKRSLQEILQSNPLPEQTLPANLAGANCPRDSLFTQNGFGVSLTDHCPKCGLGALSEKNPGIKVCSYCETIFNLTQSN